MPATASAEITARMILSFSNVHLISANNRRQTHYHVKEVLDADQTIGVSAAALADPKRPVLAAGAVLFEC
jgi:hypothetical protein